MEPVPAFATVGEADAYNAAHLFGAAWAPLSNDIKTAALNTATQLLNQNLRLAVNTTAGPIPQSLKNATSEYARILATDADTNPAESGGGTEGLKSLAVGTIKLEFAQPKDGSGLAVALPYVIIPPHILAMISHLIMAVVTPQTMMMPLRNV
jgi:hypothetical protein